MISDALKSNNAIDIKRPPGWPRALPFALCLAAGLAQGEESTGLLQELTGVDPAQLPVLRDAGVALGGWLSLGGTYNNHDPGDHSNGTVTFNDRSGELQLNQLYLFAERAVDKEAKKWSLGGRVDFLWGTDSRFTQASGHWDENLIGRSGPRFYDLALPQAYLEIATPFKRGATVKIGHFYTILGQEVVQAPNNFFYSHAYAMQYGEPFTHTGALFNYPAGANLSLNLGAVTAPYGKADNFDRHLENWNFLGGATWASEDGGTSLAASLTTGAVSAPGSPHRTIAAVVLSHGFGERLRYILQFDHGVQSGASARGDSAIWQGLNQYLIYTLNEQWSLGLRAEWLRDHNGFRVLGAPASYYETTLGADWKPKPWLLLRAEARYDWSDGPGRSFDEGRRDSQLSLGANAAVSF